MSTVIHPDLDAPQVHCEEQQLPGDDPDVDWDKRTRIVVGQTGGVYSRDACVHAANVESGYNTQQDERNVCISTGTQTACAHSEQLLLRQVARALRSVRMASWRTTTRLLPLEIPFCCMPLADGSTKTLLCSTLLGAPCSLLTLLSCCEGCSCQLRSTLQCDCHCTSLFMRALVQDTLP